MRYFIYILGFTIFSCENEKHVIKKIVLLITAPCMFMLVACDPYYSITVTNHSSDTVKMFVKETQKFSTEKYRSGVASDGSDIYVLAPAERMNVGHAIAEIDNDLPFDTLKIITHGDTLTATNTKEMKRLFDKNLFLGLKKPYNISIK